MIIACTLLAHRRHRVQKNRQAQFFALFVYRPEFFFVQILAVNVGGHVDAANAGQRGCGTGGFHVIPGEWEVLQAKIRYRSGRRNAPAVGAYNHAFARSPASRVTPFLYTGIAFATLGGWLVFSHVPNSLAFTGMLLIVGCGLLAGWVTLREQSPGTAS